MGLAGAAVGPPSLWWPPVPGPRASGPLALVLAAGGLPLDLPRPLLVCAVADGALINLHLAAGWYHRCVCVTVWTWGGKAKGQEHNKELFQSVVETLNNDVSYLFTQSLA